MTINIADDGQAQRPDVDPCASWHAIPATARIGEPGSHALCRDIATYLASVLRGPASHPLYRENPWDHEPCAAAWFFTATVAGHQIEVTASLRERGPARFFLALDHQDVPFCAGPVEPISLQIVRAIWLAVIEGRDR